MPDTTCQFCEKNDAAHVCYTCVNVAEEINVFGGVLICEACMRNHHSCGIFLRHQTSSLQSQYKKELLKGRLQGFQVSTVEKFNSEIMKLNVGATMIKSKGLSARNVIHGQLMEVYNSITNQLNSKEKDLNKEVEMKIRSLQEQSDAKRDKLKEMCAAVSTATENLLAELSEENVYDEAKIEMKLEEMEENVKEVFQKKADNQLGPYVDVDRGSFDVDLTANIKTFKIAKMMFYSADSIFENAEISSDLRSSVCEDTEYTIPHKYMCRTMLNSRRASMYLPHPNVVKHGKWIIDAIEYHLLQNYDQNKFIPILEHELSSYSHSTVIVRSQCHDIPQVTRCSFNFDYDEKGKGRRKRDKVLRDVVIHPIDHYDLTTKTLPLSKVHFFKMDPQLEGMQPLVLKVGFKGSETNDDMAFPEMQPSVRMKIVKMLESGKEMKVILNEQLQLKKDCFKPWGSKITIDGADLASILTEEVQVVETKLCQDIRLTRGDNLSVTREVISGTKADITDKPNVSNDKHLSANQEVISDKLEVISMSKPDILGGKTMISTPTNPVHNITSESIQKIDAINGGNGADKHTDSEISICPVQTLPPTSGDVLESILSQTSATDATPSLIPSYLPFTNATNASKVIALEDKCSVMEVEKSKTTQSTTEGKPIDCNNNKDRFDELNDESGTSNETPVDSSSTHTQEKLNELEQTSEIDLLAEYAPECSSLTEGLQQSSYSTICPDQNGVPSDKSAFVSQDEEVNYVSSTSCGVSEATSSPNILLSTPDARLPYVSQPNVTSQSQFCLPVAELSPPVTSSTLAHGTASKLSPVSQEFKPRLLSPSKSSYSEVWDQTATQWDDSAQRSLRYLTLIIYGENSSEYLNSMMVGEPPAHVKRAWADQIRKQQQVWAMLPTAMVQILMDIEMQRFPDLCEEFCRFKIPMNIYKLPSVIGMHRQYIDTYPELRSVLNWIYQEQVAVEQLQKLSFSQQQAQKASVATSYKGSGGSSVLSAPEPTSSSLSEHESIHDGSGDSQQKSSTNTVQVAPLTKAFTILESARPRSAMSENGDLDSHKRSNDTKVILRRSTSESNVQQISDNKYQPIMLKNHDKEQHLVEQSPSLPQESDWIEDYEFDIEATSNMSPATSSSASSQLHRDTSYQSNKSLEFDGFCYVCGLQGHKSSSCTHPDSDRRRGEGWRNNSRRDSKRSHKGRFSDSRRPAHR